MPNKKFEIREPGAYDNILFPKTTADQVIIGNTDVEQRINGMDGALSPHIADMTRHVPYINVGGTANVYTGLLQGLAAYVDGLGISIRIGTANTGASSLNINGLGARNILKQNGSGVSANNLKAGVPYTLRYAGTPEAGNFILQGEGGEGNAAAGDVLQGRTFTNDTGLTTGTMVNRGTISATPTKDMLSYGAGYYSGVNVAGDYFLQSPYIRRGYSIFGVSGTCDPYQMSRNTYSVTIYYSRRQDISFVFNAGFPIQWVAVQFGGIRFNEGRYETSYMYAFPRESGGYYKAGGFTEWFGSSGENYLAMNTSDLSMSNQTRISGNYLYGYFSLLSNQYYIDTQTFGVSVIAWG